jgi:uncharacterized protein YodC (DUF2158 family)
MRLTGGMSGKPAKDEIEPGDIVVLKSGSLEMTVARVDTIDMVRTAWVVWSDKKQRQHQAGYPLAALKKAD